MKKPEKRAVAKIVLLEFTQGERIADARGYNKCWDDREKWLPSMGELMGLVAQAYTNKENENKILDIDLANAIAEIISKRLRGER